MNNRAPTPPAAPSKAHRGPLDTDPKRQRFFESAEGAFQRFGFRKATVEEICRGAGMSKRTFYQLFGDKQDLLFQLVEAVMNTRTVAWEASLPEGLDPLSQLHSLLDLYASIVRHHPFLKVLVEDLDLMRSVGARTEEIRMSQMGGPFDRILEEGVATGQFRPLDRQAALWVVFGILDTGYLLTPAIMNAPGPLEDPVMAEEIKQFIVRGLGAIDQTDGESEE